MHITSFPPIERDSVLRIALIASALTCALILTLILFSTLRGAWPALAHVWQALTSARWAPLAGEFGLLAMLAGSLAVSLLALALAAPLALLVAVWMHLYAPRWLRRPLGALYELLAGIPSVVYGLWGLMLLVPLVNRFAPPGATLLTAALVLALMILPYGVLLLDSRLRQIPRREQEAALACGLSRWGGFRAVHWPRIRGGALRAMVLQFGRALGETMAVLMVAGNVVRMPDSLFAPVRTLTANIALEMGYAGDQHRAALFLSGALLLMLTMLIMAWVRETTG